MTKNSKRPETSPSTRPKTCHCGATFIPAEVAKEVFRCESNCSPECEDAYLKDAGSYIWQRGY